MKRSINIWMQMLGFNMDDPDRGVSRFLERTGFVPDSVCALLFHPDFVHLHRGMDEEYTLFPDNCAYRAVLRNTERFRQPWTNYAMRELIAQLKKRGIAYYAGIMGPYMYDMFHPEWLSDHPELRTCKIGGRGGLMCLKRFSDGTYYEDFFAHKLVETLVDYDCAGIHLADGFCPSGHLFATDYSTDMVEQYLAHTADILPDEIAKTMGDDSQEAASLRQKYLWGNKRKAWLGFWQWRWKHFFQKVCTAVHAVGKEVWVLGMYCSDPFETRYVYGFDTRQVLDAGVDCITANILPSSVTFEQPRYPYYFHRMHMDLPLLRTQVSEHKVLSMVSIHDAAEEWSMIDHAPVRVERDVYTMTSFVAKNQQGSRPCADGVFICLGDGVSPQHWEYIKKRIDIGFDAETVRSLSPMMLWSDAAHEAMLDAYMETRRTTPHKQTFEIFKAGVPFGGAVRSEHLNRAQEILFVPNFDMLSPDEQASLSAYPHPWIATAPTGFVSEMLHPAWIGTDLCSDYPMDVFSVGFTPDESQIAELQQILATEDSTPSTGDTPEREVHPPVEELPFRKLSAGFIQACATLLKWAAYTEYPVKCNHPMLAQQLSDGSERLYIFNRYDNAYISAVVESAYPITDAQIASAFPVLPVKFVDEEETSGFFDYDNASTAKTCFQIKLAPDGLSIIDIRRKTP